jgi:dTDP-4-dehydrorhamnose reductase
MVHGEPVVVVSIKAPGKKVLILGASGMLGHALPAVFPDAILKGHELDITNKARIKSYIHSEKPAIVINAAAYTDVEGAEDGPELAFAVNARAAGSVAEACSETGALLVHYSTDYIFNGEKEEYFENDSPDPLNVYGKSKLLGEQLIRDSHDSYLIIRTSWLYGPHGKNFVDSMIALSGQMEFVRVVNDQFGRPTYTKDLAAGTKEILGREPGIYHLTNDGTCSWYEFARAIIPNAVPCPTAEFPRKARRPQYSVLRSTKTRPLRHWREALADYLSTKNRSLCP